MRWHRRWSSCSSARSSWSRARVPSRWPRSCMAGSRRPRRERSAPSSRAATWTRRSCPRRSAWARQPPGGGWCSRRWFRTGRARSPGCCAWWPTTAATWWTWSTCATGSRSTCARRRSSWSSRRAARTTARRSSTRRATRGSRYGSRRTLSARASSRLRASCADSFRLNQALAECPKGPARLGVVRLGVGGSLLLAVEEPPADALELSVGCQPHRCGRARLEAIHRPANLLEHDLRRHVRARVKAVDGDLVRGDALGQLDRVHDLGELRLTVGTRAAVVAGQHRAVEIDRRLAERGHVDDPGRGAVPQQRQEPLSEQEPGQIVDGEAELIAVAALLAPPALREAGANAGVADQHVQLLMGLLDLVGERTHLAKVRQIGEMERDAVVARFGADLSDRALATFTASPVDEHGRALSCQLSGDAASEAIGRAGHEDGGHPDSCSRSLAAVAPILPLTMNAMRMADQDRRAAHAYVRGGTRLARR